MNKILIALVLTVVMSGNVFAECRESGRTVTGDPVYECSDPRSGGGIYKKICSQEKDRNGNRIEVCR